MAIIKPLSLYENRDAISQILNDYNISSAKIFGEMLENTSGTTADLDLIIEFPSELDANRQELNRQYVYRNLKKLFPDSSIKVYTINQLQNPHNFSPNRSKAILASAKPLREVIDDGKKQHELKVAVQKILNRLKGFDRNNPSENYMESIVELGAYYYKIHDPIVIKNDIYYLFADSERELIDFSMKWNIHYAAANNLIAELEDIFKYKPDFLDSVDLHFGDTALHKAVTANNVEAAEYLISKGAKLTLKNKKNQSIFDVAENHLFLRLHDPKFKKLAEMLAKLPEAPQFFKSHVFGNPTGQEDKLPQTGHGFRTDNILYNDLLNLMAHFSSLSLTPEQSNEIKSKVDALVSHEHREIKANPYTLFGGSSISGQSNSSASLRQTDNTVKFKGDK